MQLVILCLQVHSHTVLQQFASIFFYSYYAVFIEMMLYQMFYFFMM